MASAAALNITLSIGDVSFHLAPSSSTNDLPPSSPQARANSPYAVHRKRQQIRRSGSSVRSGTTPFSQHQQQQQQQHQQQHQQQQHYAPSPPIVTIRHGSSHPPPNNSSSPTAAASSSNFPPQSSPLQQHILGRVRSMKDVFESSQEGRNKSAAPHQAAAQSPLPSSPARDTTNTTTSGDYCVDLHSFTGTLHITSLKNNVDDTISWEQKQQSMYNNNWGEQKQQDRTNPSSRTMVHSPRKRTANNDYATDNNSAVLSKKRNKSFTWTSFRDAANNGDNEDERECENFGERMSSLSTGTALSQSTTVSKKAVRFSMVGEPSNGPSNSNAKPTTSSSSSSGGKENDHPMSQTTTQSRPQPTNTIDTNNRTTIQSQQQQQQMQPAPKPKNTNFFSSSSPTAAAAFSSPPRAAIATAKASMNIARETSSVLARSSKHVLKQITLAGKDVYDVLNGDAILSSSSNNNATNATSTNGQGGSRMHGPDSNSSGNDDDVYDASDGTELHYACASNSLDTIKNLLENDSLVDLHTADCGGKLPIHIFTENHQLINDDPLGCEEVVFTMIQVMGPDRALQALHPCGLAPFVYVIGAWTEWLHRGRGPEGSMTAQSAAQLDEENSGSVTPVASSSSSHNAPSRRRRVTYRSLFHLSTGNDRSLVSSSDRAKLLYLPESVTISDHVRWAIRILSRLIDEYPEQIREAILTNIACVPLFLKSLLLISDADEMTELLDMSLVKHTVLDKRSINVWLCAMLTDTKEVKKRAVTFIKLLSRLTLHDLASTSQCPDRYSEKEIERFTMLREDTFNAVYVMPGIVPAVLELGGQMIENVSTTRVMRYITDRTIRKESVFFVLIGDFFYSIFLLMGYRLNVEFVLNYQSVDGPEHYREYNYISTSTYGIACYFLFKEAMTLLSLYLTSKKLAKRYCSSVFNIIDVASVAMLLGTKSALTSDPSLQDNEGYAASLTIILLWLKLMGAFKILNGAFALFLYAVHEVIKEVKWFLLFLVAVTLMFSDAARTVVAVRGDCQYNVDGVGNPITDEFCSDNLFDVIIRMYSVLVGDVALEYFQSSDTMVAVFILFSFFSITILLNILIAIIIDSYEGSKQRSREIFYRARIEYAAHLVARKQFLTPKGNPDFHVATYVPPNARRALRGMYRMVSVIAALAVEYGFFGAFHYLTLESKYDYRMIRSLIIVYVCVGTIFNLYVFSVAVVALFSKYDKRFNGLNWLVENRHTTLHGIIKKVIWFLDKAVKLLHRLLGFNADRSDISEEFLITGEDK